VDYRLDVLLAVPSGDFAASAARAFRRRGWKVYAASSGQEARRLASEIHPAAAVLAIELPDESGWLTCEKLQRAAAAPRVILLTRHETPFHADFSAFVGAAGFVNEADGTSALVDAAQDAVAMTAAC
jgi:ActR/RegA family two-component response regulator